MASFLWNSNTSCVNIVAKSFMSLLNLVDWPLAGVEMFANESLSHPWSLMRIFLAVYLFFHRSLLCCRPHLNWQLCSAVDSSHCTLVPTQKPWKKGSRSPNSTVHALLHSRSVWDSVREHRDGSVSDSWVISKGSSVKGGQKRKLHCTWLDSCVLSLYCCPWKWHVPTAPPAF